MVLTPLQVLITVLMMVIGTIATRFLPFLCFPGHRQTPSYILYLGKVLPYAVMGLLVVYCLKGISVVKAPYALPELFAILAVMTLHLWKKNTLLSIGGGTVVYMLLVQMVFV